MPAKPIHAEGPRRKLLKRFEIAEHARFLTFSTYQRLPLLGTERIRDRFAEHLGRARHDFGFNLYAWVVMPEHVHLLLWPRMEEATGAVILRELKRRFAEEVITRWRELRAPVLWRLKAPDGSMRFWQRGGGYDRNIFSEREFGEKLRYIHQNPVVFFIHAYTPAASARWPVRASVTAA